MVSECEYALVFWNKESKGTKREIEMLKKHNKPYELFLLDKTSTDFNTDFNLDFLDSIL
jgi:hypothetical protein